MARVTSVTVTDERDMGEKPRALHIVVKRVHFTSNLFLTSSGIQTMVLRYVVYGCFYGDNVAVYLFVSKFTLGCWAVFT